MIPVLSPNDPYFNNVSLLLSARDGVIKDYSKNNPSISVNGNTAISSSQAYFGNKSIYFDGVGDYLTVPYNSSFDVGANNFSIEFWFYPISNQDGTLFFKGSYTTGNIWNNPGYGIRFLGQKLRYYFNTTTSFSTEKYYDSSVVSLNEWHFVSLVVSNGIGYAFLNGNLLNVGGYQNIGTIQNSNYGLTIGRFPFSSVNLDYFGYIQKIRFTPQIARYTSNFTVPTQPFPNW